MIPFRYAVGTSPHTTKMLVELMLCPLTFRGGAEGSEVNTKNKLYKRLFMHGVADWVADLSLIGNLYVLVKKNLRQTIFFIVQTITIMFKKTTFYIR